MFREGDWEEEGQAYFNVVEVGRKAADGLLGMYPGIRNRERRREEPKARKRETTGKEVNEEEERSNRKSTSATPCRKDNPLGQRNS